MEQEARPFIADYYDRHSGTYKTFKTVKDWIEYWIPYEWRDCICMCLSPKADYSGTRPSRCKACGKFERWQLLIACRTCNNPFFSSFTHHADDSRMQCWDCLVAEHGVVEGDIPPAAEPKVLRPLNEILADDDIFGEELNFTL